MSEKRKDSKGRNLRNGEVQRNDGKYMYRYTDKTGKRQTVYSWKLVETDKLPDGKRNSPALRTLEKQLQTSIDTGIDPMAAKKTTLNTLFDKFIKDRFDLRQITKYNYSRNYDAHIRENIGDIPVGFLTSETIASLYVKMVESEHLKPSSIKNANELIGQLMSLAIRDNIIKTNPTPYAWKEFSRKYDTNVKKMHALTIREQEIFIQFIYNSNFKQWGPLFTFLLGTGVRVSEALGLRWEDCDFDSEFISINHSLSYIGKLDVKGVEFKITPTKTRSGNRIIPMFKDVKEALLEVKKIQEIQNFPPCEVDGYTGFVFLGRTGKVISGKYIYHVCRRARQAYNDKEMESAQRENRAPELLPVIGPHTLRHTFCTRMCENEPNIKVIQEVMGHNDIKTTLEIYSEATKEEKRLNFKKAEGKFALRG